MVNGLCHSAQWSALGTLGGWSWIGLILNLVLWVGLLAGLALLVIGVLRRGRVQADGTAYTGQSIAKETLQAQSARDEITQEPHEQHSN